MSTKFIFILTIPMNLTMTTKKAYKQSLSISLPLELKLNNILFLSFFTIPLYALHFWL